MSLNLLTPISVPLVCFGLNGHAGRGNRDFKILTVSLTRQTVGEMHPWQHLIGVEVYAGLYVFRMVEQRCVKVHFIGKPLCSKEHRRAAFPTEATGISRTALIADRHLSKKLPADILVSDPRRERRGGCSAATLTVAVTDPIGISCELKSASAAEASPSDGRHHFVGHDLGV